MKAYHGSPKQGLKELIFKAENSRFLENLAEGEGIYLTADYEVAKSYAMGGSIYHLSFTSDKVLDATKSTQFEDILSKVSEDFNIDGTILNVPYINETVEAIIDGSSSITKFGESVRLILDNDEGMMSFFESNGGYEMTETVSAAIQKKIDEYPIIKYVDRGINQSGSIIFLIRDSSAIEIIKEETL